ncbi:MAG: adenylyltransferase/cytidyltransferase family protein [Rhodobacteraceae bacterium]|nr:adenylyltransferase/cytidyltransferase family protein [Paracoccaceae bacterium]
MKSRGQVVITYGTFDLFHVGHVNLLERARALGDRLIVGVSTDEFNSVKGKRSIFPYEHRARIVEAMKCVDEVFPETDWSQKNKDIERFNANVFVMGHDWQGRFDDEIIGCKVVYLPRTEGISTTEIKSLLGSWNHGTVSEIKNGLDFVQSIIEDLRK